MLRGIGLCLLLLAAFARAEDPEIYKLRRYGLSPTYESLRSYLRALYPAPGLIEELERRVDELSHPRAERREYAIRELQEAGAAAASVLARAVERNDPGTVWHATWLLESAQELLNSTPMYATYMTIARRQIRGLTEEVILSIPLAKDSYVRVAGRKALEATATPKDAELLRKVLKEGDAEMRAAALRALASVLGPAARAEIREFVTDTSTEVRYAAAMALVALKDPAALDALVSLLEASEPQVRYSSVKVLRTLSGKRFKFAAYATPEDREPKVELWRKWARSEGIEIKWSEARAKPEGYHNRILVSVSQAKTSELIEIDLNGAVIWSKKITGNIQGAQGLANGHRLVSFWGRRIVVEYDRVGKELWRSPQFKSNPGCVQRLAGGATLVCFPMTGEIREISATGETLRTLNVGKGFYFAERLQSGITRVGHYQNRKVIDLDRHGQVVRQTQLSVNPFTVRKLESGNTLVCVFNTGHVEEHGPNGKVVRDLGQYAGPTSAFRIANGVTLIGDRKGVWRIDREGQRRQLLRRAGTVWISYY